MTTHLWQVLVLNQISPSGLQRLPAPQYTLHRDTEGLGRLAVEPDAILLRSADLHRYPIGASVKAIARAGAGTNNIPVDAMTRRGVPVFNAPGANANAVKELVLAGMLMAARHLPAALRFVDGLDPSVPDLDKVVEDGKKRFAGSELAGQTLGIVGLGRIGCQVADAALALGMQVIGYDPDITIDAAWSLSSQVRRATTLDELLRASNFVTLHVPLVDATRGLIDARRLAVMPEGAVLLNFSREGVVDDAAVLAALETRRLGRYVCDFPSAALHGRDGVIALPHLGASTREAEDNCARMVADQLRDYLEHGNVANAVNFPSAQMPRGTHWRLAIANVNVPNMLGQLSTAIAQAGLNIHDMLNKSRGDLAYTIVDVDSEVPAQAIEAMRAIDGVLAVRYLASMRPDAIEALANEGRY
ncbi:MAG: phosphoglycerate dehydrogenase [Burkholderiaceae bacterium]